MDTIVSVQVQRDRSSRNANEVLTDADDAATRTAKLAKLKTFIDEETV